MKIILSRKGFDAGAGGFASPIMPCGRLLSLPIPVTPTQMENGEVGIPYADLRFDGQPVSEIINQLSRGRFDVNRPSHLDPDLDRDRYEPREQGWKQTFGQQDRWQTHLRSKEVGEDDLFLFFGRFRRTKYENSQLKYVPPKKGGKDIHIIFGWLQVGGKPLAVNGDDIPDWLHYHPHIVNGGIYPNNTIYIAAEHLTLDGHNLSRRGAGTFPCFKPSLQLSDPRGPMGRWRLPKWFYPTPPKPPLSCHDNLERWAADDDHTFLQSVPIGQEFVFDTERYPEAIDWLKGLFENCC